MTKDIEGMIEQAYWDFDAERAKTGVERDAFKHKVRKLIRDILYNSNDPVEVIEDVFVKY